MNLQEAKMHLKYVQNAHKKRQRRNWSLVVCCALDEAKADCGLF